jgi:hypothetical protein
MEGVRISGSFEKRLRSGLGNTSEKEAVHENPTASSSENVIYKVRRNFTCDSSRPNKPFLQIVHRSETRAKRVFPIFQK